jgi:nicotinate-nucleotide pyrophosphorylase (carboxylating)
MKCHIDWTDPFAVAEVLIENALSEDEALNDAATGALADCALTPVVCLVNARENLVAAGIDLAAIVFSMLPGNAVVERTVEEGSRVLSGETMARINGPASSVLRGERIFLNILCRLCGIAGKTAELVSICAGTGVEILDTRKTTPGMRALEKYAVRVGGGTNHRFSLSDMAMLKDNHIAACGGVQLLLPVLERVRRLGVPIEIEVDNLSQFRTVLHFAPDRILLDNMTIEELEEAVLLAEDSGIYLEASGGITAETVRSVAETGVNGISAGMLTHSVKASDIGLDWHYGKESV